MDLPKGSGVQSSNTCSSHVLQEGATGNIPMKPCGWQMSWDVKLQIWGCYSCPLTGLPLYTFGHLLTHSPHRDQRSILKMWLGLIIHLLMNFHYDFKWIQTLYIHPSRPSRICLRSPLQPNLGPPHSYLCLQGTDHSFRASDPTLPLPLQNSQCLS